MRFTTAAFCIAAAFVTTGCLPDMPRSTVYGGLGGYGNSLGYGVADSYGRSWRKRTARTASTAYGWGAKQTAGGLGGAALGGWGGAQIGKGNGRLAAVATGTLLGWLVGSNIGASLDKADLLAAERGLDQSMQSNEAVQWEGPNATGYVQPLRSGRAASGELCREYQQTVTIGGRTEKLFGQACRQSDGSWRVAT